jgi:large subunit ribosomal protein L1
MAHGKRYRQQYDKVQRGLAHSPAEAISLVKETASAKFDETVELHVLLGVNVRHADEQLRGTLALPHGLGKDVTVAVFAQGQQARDAEAAGADHVGGQELVEKVQEGWTDFDVAISTPEMMKAVGQLGRVLGPQGKMPNPKVGTVTDEVEKAVADSKSGKVEYRTDRQAIVHMAIGKASFDESKLLDNYQAVMEEIVRAKPASAKGRYIVSATLATTMGPGIRVDSGKAADREAAAGAGETAEEPATV